MLLRLRAGCATLLLVALVAPGSANAWNPFKAAGDAAGDALKTGGRKLGEGLGQGAVEAMQPALLSTLGAASQAASRLVADVDLRLTGQVDHAGGVASKLLSQTKGAVDDSLDKVDHLLEKRLLQVQTTADGLVEKLDGTIDRNLHTADRILKERSTQLGHIVADSIQHADQALEARINQLDEDVALRLGNVDVIATKQRLGLEETLVRAGVLLGILVFIIFVVRTLWKEFEHVQTRVGHKRGIKRTLGYLRGLVEPLLFPLTSAALGVLVIYALYDRLPLGARTQATELATMHRQQMDAGLARFDFARTRFHASQLEILVPEQGAYYQAMAGKAALLRDLVIRPALLATKQGISEVVERVNALERQLGPLVDPDVLTLKAMVVWQVGDSKRDEHDAASYCARALRLSPGGFALAPLARHYIRAFLHAPYLAPGTPYGRDAESLQDLRVLATAPMETDAGFPLAPVLALDRLLGQLDRAVTPAYLDLLQAHAAVVKLLPARDDRSKRKAPPESPELAAARKQRTQAAQKVLELWDHFDRDLDAVPGIGGKTAILAIFRLNDATYSRAAWFVAEPSTDDVAPLLADVANLAVRVKVAPPRVRWERRYGDLIASELHSLAELQEADRFSAFERDTQAFERAYVAAQVGAGPEQDAQRRSAAVLAAKLGLYVSGASHGTRISVAETLLTADDRKDTATASKLAAAFETRGLRVL
jgi:hypothetical protein